MRKASWNANLYNTRHDYVSRYGADVLALLQPIPNETILDLGCGTGTLTHEIAKLGANVVGIDSSDEMIKKAQKDYPQIAFRVADGQNFEFDNQFDAVFSNAALHWMLEPEKVIACVWKCLKVNGRFVLEMGGKGNIQQVLGAIVQALKKFNLDSSLLNYFPSIAQYAGLLEAQGLNVRYAEMIDRPTKLTGPEGLRNWMRMFRDSALQQLRQGEQEAFFQYLEQIAQPTLYHDNGWWADYVRLRVVAIKPNQ
jgi:trans-aconitate methyltransferase